MFVSVIIPVQNEEKYISECIESIIKQSYPKDLIEVFLIDGQSQDSTRDIIKTYTDKYSYLRLLANDKKIPPTAMNMGIRASKGDIIIRMDAHAKYDEQYIARCVDALNTVNADNVGGPIVTLPGANTMMAKAIALATSHPFGVGNSKFRTSHEAQYVDTVPFGAYRKKIFDKIGLFNEKLIRNQDIELNARLIKAGGKIFLDPKIKSYYYNRATLMGLLNQNFRNGMWNIFTHAASENPLSLRHYVPLMFVLSFLVGAILVLVNPVGYILLGIVLLSYLAADAFFSITLGARRDWKLIPILLAVFLTLHFSYGIGSLWGVVKVHKWKNAFSK